MAIIDESKFESNVANGVATVTYSDAEAFKNGTDIPFTELKKTFDYAGEYIEDATNKSATFATELMEKDKSVNKVVVELPYGVSKRGSMAVTANREKTFPGMNGHDATTKSTINVVVKDAATKMSRTKIKALESTMTEKLLG